ncbi:2-succinyl-5-enolpyruvyl-6-hydroxy-3-cyclohexene-1-carboxylic-acid synthase [Peribacillus alkalitolerans]|uniref:2-succinyl-5-enolpyruvyl-6-hydroxy-3- cyclohexene-1-carboxylic-acid synthase n=1 Tax=Peribacillus alkalitolerans TaxID=1550385 RepID=UPI0013D3CE3E|nr:2-succinyl-5-enolpyruvyl-6-hydroxy-3-cyclohexene-1-carboxylic-acid synthase [Peribacillus alkalitolerans]
MEYREALTAYASAFIDELTKVNVKHAVVSPGSRSTPLALLLAMHPGIKIHVNVDERSAGFFALGLAKALGEPVALLCTSGTAAANYYPAIIEASYSRVPLIVLTADRPHELRDVGAPQAIDQIHLYGKHVKWFSEMALPEKSEEIVRYARTVSARAAATAIQAPAGPVHLNFPLREPLVPYLDDPKLFQYGTHWNEMSVTVRNGNKQLEEMEYKKLSSLFRKKQKGVIVCGYIEKAFTEEICGLSEKLGYPILADPLSQLRSGYHSKANVVDTYDTFLRFPDIAEELVPDVIIRFGAMPISKSLTQFLKKQTHAQHIVVDAGSGWREPTGVATHILYCDNALFCKGINKEINGPTEFEWLNKWKDLNVITKSGLDSIRDDDSLNEGKLVTVMQEIMPDQSTLFVGNSMPIRDVDTFFHNHDKTIQIYANRGANGIDGLVSTALGVSSVNNDTVLLLGDLSFFHDMNGLLSAKMNGQDLIIVIVNNDGGGIFSFLPQSSEKDYFEQLFGTPHGMDFSHAIEMYGGKYHRAESWDDFEARFRQAFEQKGLRVIEVNTEREENVTKHRELWEIVAREINMSRGNDHNEIPQ